MVSIGRKRASLMRESKVLKVSTPSVQPLTISLRWKHSLPLLHPLNPSRDPPFTTSGSGSFPNSPRLTTLAGAMNTSRRPTDSCHTSRRPTDSCPRHADQLVAEPDVAAARLQRTTRRTADGSRTAQIASHGRLTTCRSRLMIYPDRADDRRASPFLRREAVCILACVVQGILCA
jgi:hypothetical protein